MKCQILFSRKNKKIFEKCCLLKFLPSMQSVISTHWNPKWSNSSVYPQNKHFWRNKKKINTFWLDIITSIAESLPLWHVQYSGWQPALLTMGHSHANSQDWPTSISVNILLGSKCENLEIFPDRVDNWGDYLRYSQTDLVSAVCI